MSYNITSWKTRKIENLTIPLDALYIHPRKDWHPSKPILLNPLEIDVEIECGCGQSIKGTLSDDGLMLNVTELDMSGEGSGTFKGWILDEALKRSKGTLEAVLIWEGGDSVTKLSLQDGKLEESPVEL